jgi:ketosteroid isomerase-like protein
MSGERVEVVRGAMEAFQRGAVDEMLAAASDELVMDRADPEGLYFHGRGGLMEALADWTEGFADFAIDPKEYFEAGDWVVVRVEQTARGRDSGAPVTGDYWFAHEVREGKVVRLEIYVDRDAAFAAAGAQRARRA